MPVRVTFEGTLLAPVPVAYVVPKAAMPDSALHRLRLHGVLVEDAKGPVQLDGVQAFMVDSIIRSGQPFQGHQAVRLEGTWGSASPFTLAGEAYVIRTAQPLGVLAMQLLEPQSDDGLVTWNYFDGALDALSKQQGPKPFPVYRATKPVSIATRIIP
jgi:hypothetical protein